MSARSAAALSAACFTLCAALAVSASGQSSTPCGSWVPLSTPNPVTATHAILRDVVTIAPNDVWAVGEASVSGASVGGQSITMTLHFDGGAWSIVPSPSPTGISGGANDFLWAAAATSSSDVWAGGGQYKQAPDGFYGLHILVERWNGSAWQVMNTPVTVGGSGSHVSGIKAFAPNDVWFVGDWMDMAAVGQAVQKALAMHWDGSKFTVFPTPFFNPAPGSYGAGHGMEAVDGVAPNDVWAVGGAHDGDASKVSQILHYDGSQWTRVLGPEPPGWQRLNAVEAIAANDVWAGGERELPTGGYAPFMIHWNGSAWSEVACPIGVADLVAFASNDVYAVGGGVAHWNGAAWSIVESFPSVTGPSLAGVSAAGDCSSLIAVGRQLEGEHVMNFSAHVVSGAWSDLGGALSGSLGAPVLAGQGPLTAGSTTTLSLAQANPSSPAVVFVGTQLAGIPFLGGTLVPAPPAIILPVATSANGSFLAAGIWPAGVPSGAHFYFQCWIADPGAIFGASASNGLLAIAP